MDQPCSKRSRVESCTDSDQEISPTRASVQPQTDNSEPLKPTPDKNAKVAAIQKHQQKHLMKIPDSVVPYDKAVEQSQLPEVYPGMHDYKAYGEEDLSKEEGFTSSAQHNVVGRSHQQPVFFNEILNLTSQKKFIALIGPPGSGKTTLSKRLAKLSQSNQSAKFLLRFMDLGYGECLTYKQLFVDFLCPELDKETKENAFHWMMEHPDKCVFVFDGYDQATWSLENVKPPNVSHDTPLPIDQLVANLCNQKFFKESLLIFTSRPHSILKIPSDLRPDVTVHVDDLSTDDMKKLFKSFAGERADKLWQTLTTRAPQLFSLGHNPLLLQFVIFTLLHQSSKQVNTITEVFQVVLEQLRYSENAHGMDIKKIWRPLCKMAYEGMQRETVVFTTDNLIVKGLDATVVQDVIIAFARCIGFPTQRLFDGDQLFYFSHQMLQEMFAAKFICDFMSDEDFHTIIEPVVKGGHWSMVRRFLCGLLLGVKNRKDKSSTFLHLLTKKLNKSEGRELLELLVDLQECSDEVVDLCAKHVPSSLNLGSIPISLGAAHALAEILPKLDQPVEKLDLQVAKLNSELMNWICKGITKMKHKIKEFDLGGNEMGDDGLRHLIPCLDKIEKLWLWKCSITSKGVQGLSEGLKRLTIPMKELGLDRNKIGEQGLRYLASCLSKIEKLRLTDCNVTSKGVQIVTESLKNLVIPMKELNLSQNKIGEEGLRRLGSCLSKIEMLHLFHCNITPKGVQILTESIKPLVMPLKKLFLSGTDIGDEGVRYLICCLDKIEKLVLFDCDITSTGVSTLSEGLKKLVNPMKQLELDNNEIGEDGIRHLTGCLDKMEKLVLKACDIDSDGVQIMTGGLKKLVIPMKELDLSNNAIGDEGVRHLTSCLDKMEKLVLGRCNMTSAGVDQGLYEAIHNLNLPMSGLELSYNRIDDEAVKHLTKCLDKLKELVLEGCRITNAGKQTVQDALRNLNLPSSTVKF